MHFHPLTVEIFIILWLVMISEDEVLLLFLAVFKIQPHICRSPSESHTCFLLVFLLPINIDVIRVCVTW